MTNEDAIRVFESWIEQDKNLKYADRLENIEIYQIAIEALNEQRPHGEWEYCGGILCARCSVCKEVAYETAGNFCPNCGASMVKKEGDENG